MNFKKLLLGKGFLMLLIDLCEDVNVKFIVHIFFSTANITNTVIRINNIADIVLGSVGFSNNKGIFIVKKLIDRLIHHIIIY